MQKHSTVFIGLDVHKESIAIGVATAGRAAGRFVGTAGAVAIFFAALPAPLSASRPTRPCRHTGFAISNRSPPKTRACGTAPRPELDSNPKRYSKQGRHRCFYHDQSQHRPRPR
jgi:hypothetical protein